MAADSRAPLAMTAVAARPAGLDPHGPAAWPGRHSQTRPAACPLPGAVADLLCDEHPAVTSTRATTLARAAPSKIHPRRPAAASRTPPAPSRWQPCRRVRAGAQRCRSAAPSIAALDQACGEVQPGEIGPAAAGLVALERAGRRSGRALSGVTWSDCIAVSSKCPGTHLPAAAASSGGGTSTATARPSRMRSGWPAPYRNGPPVFDVADRRLLGRPRQVLLG